MQPERADGLGKEPSMAIATNKATSMGTPTNRGGPSSASPAGQGGRDRRRHARRLVARSCKVRHAEALRYSVAQTQDLSEGGALLSLETSRPLSAGQDVTLAIDFEGRNVLTQQQMVEAKVVRVGPVLNRRQVVAVAFRTPMEMAGVVARVA